MQLISLLERMKMDHLEAQLDTICEQASKRDLGYKEFLIEALQTEWSGRHQRGVESRLKMARFPWVKTLEQFDFTFQLSIDRKILLSSRVWVLSIVAKTLSFWVLPGSVRPIWPLP